MGPICRADDRDRLRRRHFADCNPVDGQRRGGHDARDPIAPLRLFERRAAADQRRVLPHALARMRYLQHPLHRLFELRRSATARSSGGRFSQRRRAYRGSGNPRGRRAARTSGDERGFRARRAEQGVRSRGGRRAIGLGDARGGAECGRPDPGDRGNPRRGPWLDPDRRARRVASVRGGRHVRSALGPRPFDRIDPRNDPQHCGPDQSARPQRNDRSGPGR